MAFFTVLTSLTWGIEMTAKNIPSDMSDGSTQGLSSNVEVFYSRIEQSVDAMEFLYISSS